MQSSKASNQIQGEEVESLSVDKLQQKFLNLQQDWETFKKSNPRRRKTLESSQESTTSSTITTFSYSSLMVKTLSLVDQSSPRTLVSSLQSKINDHRFSLMTTNYSEVREIVRGRREAIEAGSLKGRRRLFESYEGFGDNRENYGFVQDVQEVRSVLSFDESHVKNDNDSDGSDVSAVWVRRYSCPLSGCGGGERVVERSDVILKKKERVKMNIIGKGSSYNGWFVLVVLSFLFAICILEGFGLFGIGETKVILVPT